MKKLPQKILIAVLAGMIIFIPLIFDTSVKSNFSAPKLFTLKIFTSAIVLLIGFGILFKKKFEYRRNVLNMLVIFFGIISVVNTVISVNIFSSLYGYPGIFMGIFTLLNLLVVYLLFANLVKGEVLIMRLLFICVMTAVFVSIYGLLQHFGLIDVSKFSQFEAGRIFATFGHPNHLGAYLGMNILVALGLLFRKWQIAVFFSLVIILLGYCLVLTASRGALIATIISIVIFLGLYLGWIYPQIKNKKKFGLIIIGVTALIIVSSLLSLTKISSLKIVERTKQTVELMQQGQYPDRVSWMLSSIEMIKDRPVTGFGLSTYNDVYNEYRRTDYQVPGDIQDSITPENAHNEYLTIAATQGIPALILFLLIFINFFYQTIKNAFRNRKNTASLLLLGTIGATSVYLLQVFVSFGVVSTMTLLFILMGLGTALSSEINNQKFKTVNFKKGLHYFTFAAIIGIFLWGVFYSVRHFEAEKNIKTASRAENNGKYEESLIYYDIANALMPNNYHYYSDKGDTAFNAYLNSGNEEFLDEAKKSYKEAIEINKMHPSSFANIGLIYYTTYSQDGEERDYKIFVKSFENAIRLSPNNPLYPYKLGKLFFGIEEYENASKYFDAALKIRSPYKDTQEYLDQISSRQTTL